MSHNYALRQAALYLNLLRRGTTQYEYYLDALRRQLANGGLMLADVGTSEEELVELGPTQF